MRDDDEIAHARVVGENDVDGRSLTPRPGAPIEDVRNGLCRERAAPVRGAFVNAQEAAGVSGAKEALDGIGAICALAKDMSRPNTDDFCYLEEQEWRIPHSHRASQAGYITGTAPPYRIRLQPDDVKLIVFPEESVRSAALKDPEVVIFLSKRSSPPVMMTLGECEHF